MDPIKIDGIYEFCKNNVVVVCDYLNNIPKGTLVNYKSDCVFSVVNSGTFTTPLSEGVTMRIQTGMPNSPTTQGHCYITNTDYISYSNSSGIVRDNIIELFTQHKRENKLNSILIKTN